MQILKLISSSSSTLDCKNWSFGKLKNKARLKKSHLKMQIAIFLSKYTHSVEAIERETVKAMHQAHIEPHIIYAYQKTRGLLLTHENKHLTSKADLKEWEDAIEEYFQLKKNPRAPDMTDILFESLYDEMDSCAICLGYALEYGFNKKRQKIASSSEFFSVDDYVILYATKSIKTFRSIKTLLDDEIGADGLLLARHLLEIYLSITYSLACPDMLRHLVDAPIGLKLGTHDFGKTSKGRTDSRKIIRKSDGKEYLGHISYYKMAESSPYVEDLELFDYFYHFLSEYTHPSVTGFQLVVANDGNLSALSNELQLEAFFYSICFVVMILDELRKLPTFTDVVKKDISTVTKRISKKAVMLIEELFRTEEAPVSFKTLSDRLRHVGCS